MPIISIISQPAANSLNAAYRPIIFEVKASRTDNTAKPPVVYCDIYFNGIYYRSIEKTQLKILNTNDSDWQFDIQDACQEVIKKFIGTNGASNIINRPDLLASVSCKFRSSGFDANGFITQEGTIPIQGTSSSPPVSGTGTQSNTFYVLNTVLQHHNNQNLASHLGFFKNGIWQAEAFPLSHRKNKYKLGINSTDYFPLFYTGAKIFKCIKVFYKNRGSSVFTSVNNCGTPSGGGCVAPGSITNLPNAYLDVPYDATIVLTGTPPFNVSNGNVPAWMNWENGPSVGNNIHLWGTPNNAVNNFTISFLIENCGYTNQFTYSDTINVTSCVSPSIAPNQSLPDGSIGVPYSATINVSGDTPFTLSGIIKPSWMTVAVSGSSLVFSGTPDSAANNIAVECTVNNPCGSFGGGNNTLFQDSINVT